MKPALPITLIIVGALVALAPLTYGFILQALGEPDRLDQSSRTGCMVLGIILLVTGAILAFLSQKSGGTATK